MPLLWKYDNKSVIYRHLNLKTKVCVNEFDLNSSIIFRFLNSPRGTVGVESDPLN